MRYLTTLIGCFALGLHVAAGEPASKPWFPARFDQEMAPLFAQRCLDCHAGGRPKGGLDLSGRKSAFDGGDRGPAIVPRNLKESLLWKHINAGTMPPKKSLPQTERMRIKSWIEAGAPWGTDPIDPFRITTDQRAGYDWWSLQPVRRPAAPSVKRADWVKNPIDAFILSRLEARGLSPSAPAGPRALIRRLYFDLLGLPPPPEEVDAFAANPTESAYLKLVDRLLASPHFGERWARHWLDVVRYGESDGFERNLPRPNAWPYRDWVVQALNDDMPFDQFARLQIAGDILQPGDPGAIAATGFLVAGIHNTVVGQNEIMRLNARQDEMEDILATVGQTFLGLTVHCARCHDHKFDPVSMKDYYSLQAALAGVFHGEREVANPAIAKKETELRKIQAMLEAKLKELDDKARILWAKKRGEAPALATAPIARWSFDSDGRDQVGGLHGALKGAAVIANGRLKLNGADAYLITAPLQREIKERTLEAWVSLTTLDQKGGGVMTIERDNGAVFDSIVFAERRSRRWMAGSNFFRRTRDLSGPEESTSPEKLVHVAVVYAADGSIGVFRNGRRYDESYLPTGPDANLQTYPAEKSRVLFGLRHTGSRGFLAGEIEEARLYDRALSPAEILASFGNGPEARFVATKEVLAELSIEEQQTRAKMESERNQVIEALKALPRPGKLFAVLPKSPTATHLLARGDVMKKLEAVSAGGVVALGGKSHFHHALDAPDAERRRALASWITRSDNPLFARVIVNRLWHHHFGTGIVETPSDFGFNGGRPSHPELLDWLAAELSERRHSLKAIHRLIVTSNAYRQAGKNNAQATATDAGNRLLWRKAPMRLEAEAVRDAILAVSGQLNSEGAGPGFHDVRTYHNSGTTFYEPIDPVGKEFQRRTLYRFAPRGERSALLDAFDCPDPSAATPRRQVTTTPLQALALLNGSFVLRMADQFAERVVSETKSPDPKAMDVKVSRAYLLAFARPATEEERRLSVAFAERHGLAALCRVLFNSNEFVVIE